MPQPDGLESYLENESIEYEKREAEELQRYHGRISSWEADNQLRNPSKCEPCMTDPHGYCIYCGRNLLRDNIDKVNAALEFVGEGEPIPMDIGEGIILESKDNL